MQRLPLIRTRWLVAFATLIPGFSLKAAETNNPAIQVEARGPIHEAYAQPFQANPIPNNAVDKKPPDPIPEEPAAEKPAGKDVEWIPGYWQWDADRKDFIWVSGIWRHIPTGRRWVMGYWANTTEGYRWVSGHWAAAQEKDNQYVPDPPENPDAGATPQAPDSSSFYIPGCWFYGDDGYSYRSGYWSECQTDQCWVPSRYIWSPNGYIFASGYWDYPLGRRGLLFAPVYFTSPLWNTPGWFYQPYYAFGYGGLYDSLFVGLGYGHYFYGDYYSPFYLGFGISPWYSYARNHYDPIWSHQHWVNRNNPQWANGFHNAYVDRVNGVRSLPPRTLSAQTALVANARGAQTTQMVHSLAQLHEAGLKMETVSPQMHATQLQSARQMVSSAQTLSRQSFERAPVSASFSRGFGGSSVVPFSSGGFSRGYSPSFHSGSFVAPSYGGMIRGGYSSGAFHGGGFSGGGFHGGGFSGGGFHGGGGFSGGGGHGGGGGGGHR